MSGTEVLAVIGTSKESDVLVTEFIPGNFDEYTRRVVGDIMEEIKKAIESGVENLRVEETTVENLTEKGLADSVNVQCVR